MSKLIVFDLDGTLLYTLRDLTDSVNYAMEKLRLPKYDCLQVRQMIGNGVAVLMRRAVADRAELAETALKLQREYYLLHADDNARPYDGATEMLRRLKNGGFTVAVHTNKDENCATPMCERHFGKLIDFVCGTTSEITKPNPYKVLKLMEKLRVSPRETLYCGDSEVDVETASNIGVKCISVTWGYRDREFLKERGAEYFADSPQEAAELAANLL